MAFLSLDADCAALGEPA